MNKKFPYQLIDLTHTLSKESPSWDGGCGFNHDIKLDYDECDSTVKFRVQQVKTTNFFTSKENVTNVILHAGMTF